MLHVSMLIWNLKPALSIAFYAHCFVQSVWAGIGIADLPIPVEVVLAGPDQVHGYLLTADRSPRFRSSSSVIYRCREEDEAANEICPIPTNALANPAAHQEIDPAIYTESAVLGSWQQGVQANDVPRVGARGGVDFSANNGNGLVLGDLSSEDESHDTRQGLGDGKIHGKENDDDDSGHGNGNLGDHNADIGKGNGNSNGNANENGNANGNENGNGDHNNRGDDDGNTGGIATGNLPIGALSAPEPASLLIWLGAGLMGMGGAFARTRRRAINR